MEPSNGSLKRPIWRFAQCEYDELADQLWVGGKKAELFPKSKSVLLALLKSKGHRMSRRELMLTGWGVPEGAEQPLANAVHNLRSAISPDERDSVIRTIHGSGFQIVVPVEFRLLEESLGEGIRFASGESIPGKREWKLIEPLDKTTPHRIWLAERPTTHHTHVFKFAVDDSTLAEMRREIDVAQRLEKAGADANGFLKVFDWRDTTKPYFLETEYGGANLFEWAEDQRRHSGLSPEVCLQVITDLVGAVAVAHEKGILHNDIRPENVLVASPAGSSERWQVKLANFSRASLKDDAGAKLYGTGAPVSEPRIEAGTRPRQSGIYTAPEMRAGGPPTAASDIYALGVLLFQIMCGDFYRALTPDWESFIDDPSIREDIAETTNSDPQQRIASAARLAERLRSLEARNEQQRVLAAELQSAKERAEIAEKRITASNARRPWVFAFIALLLTGISISLFLYQRASHQRAIAEAVDSFLSEDLLGRANPYLTGHINESLVDAITQASPEIDRRFAREPLIAARLHQTIARALDNRMDYPPADHEYAAAAALYLQAEGAQSVNAVIAQLQRAAMHTRDSATGGYLQQAKLLYQQQEPMMAKLKTKSKELPVWNDYALGLIQMMGSDSKSAMVTFRDGLQQAETLPGFNIAVVLTMKQLLAVAEFRMGEGADAERLIREMMVTVARIHYTGKPNLTNLGVNLAQAYMSEQKNKEAIAQVNVIYPALVEQMGEKSALSITALGVRAQSEASLGLWDESARDSHSVYRLEEGTNLYAEAGSLSDAALAECRGAHYAQGEEDAEGAMKLGHEIALTDDAVRSSYDFSRATCLVGLKKFDEAEKLLSTINLPALKQITSDPEVGADMELTRAEIALQRGEYAAAHDHLESAKPACLRAGAAPYRNAWFHRLQPLLDQQDSVTAASMKTSA